MRERLDETDKQAIAPGGSILRARRCRAPARVAGSEDNACRAQIGCKLAGIDELDRVHAQNTRHLDIHWPVVDKQALSRVALRDLQGAPVALRLRLEQAQIARGKEGNEESLALRRSIDNKSGIPWVISNMGVDAYVQGDYATARALFEESLALFRAIGAKWGTAYILGGLGEVAREQGDYTGASALLEESLALFRASGDKRKIAEMHLLLATVALAQGETAAARAMGEEGLALYRAIGYRRGIAYGTLFLGLLARTEGHIDQAEMCFGDGLAQCHRLGATLEAAIGLACQAVLAADRAAAAQSVRSAERAAQLAGATRARLDVLQTQLIRQFRTPYEGAIAAAQAMLGDEAFGAAWQAGKQLMLDEAVAFALAPEASAS